ncbi:hypothetical protein EUX98_g9249 [Antrodiella citrinella]|uniref:Protein kinase domain-containing protein n=1 Tax=Antrodiella citrinella TaxID=2447956 RepID=A0A4S4LXD3_9APHY|nr:hypothetical protein EUX98_g9249 [Antrodiella citrinella]
MSRLVDRASRQLVPDTAEFSGFGALRPSEKRWRDRYFFLQQHGYTLRPRYHPDWKPSWLGTSIDADSSEDFIASLEGEVLDAVRTKDNFRVSIKVISNASDESRIACLLSSKKLLSDPNNHCVPIFDVLPDPLGAENSLLVMMYLRPYDDPEFEVIEEVIDFVKQTLERPVKYYFIDWGLSSYFREGESPYVLGTKCADHNAPELSNVHPYNAFMLDVFILGHMYEDDLLKVYHGLDFLEPLITFMTLSQPERRPTAEAALRMFYDIRRGLSRTTLPWRLRKREESGTERVVYDTLSAAKAGLKLVRRGLIGA